MEFDKGSKNFSVNEADRTMLGLPEDVESIPATEPGMLVDSVARLQDSLATMSGELSTYPQGPQRAQIRERQKQVQDYLRSVKPLLSEHVVLSDDSFDEL